MTELHLKHPKVVVIANNENVITYVNQELAQRAIEAADRFCAVEEALHCLPTISDNAWLFMKSIPRATPSPRFVKSPTTSWG